MVNVGPFEVVGAGVLALLATAVALAIAVLVLWATALTVVTPAMAAIDVRVRHKRLHAWRRRVRDSWLTDPEARTAALPAAAPPVRGVSRVRSQDGGDTIQLIAAGLAPPGPVHPCVYTPMSVVHARLRPASRLELPPQPGGEVVVYVLAGRGFVDGRPVRAGEAAVLAPGTPVCLAASADDAPRFEAIVLDRPAAEPAAGAPTRPATGRDVVVSAFGPRVRQRLAELRALTADVPTPHVEPVQPVARGAA